MKQLWLLAAPLTALPLFVFGCGSDGGDGDADGSGGQGSGGSGAGGETQSPSGVPALGNGQHTADSVVISVIADESHNLNQPSDLALNPLVPNEMWIVNKGDESTTVLDSVDGVPMIATRYKSFGSQHFLAKPSSIAFGDNGNFATAHETDEKTQGPDGTPADFMGPTLWPSNRDVFDSGHSSHLDMLHNSPNGVGIAWESGNTYWVYDGYHSSLTRYAFNMDHGYGGADHSDGEIKRYVEGEVGYVENVPSQMDLDHARNLLFAADTGNNRVVALDITTGTEGANIFPNYDGLQKQVRVDGATLYTFINGVDFGLTQPSGLALHDGLIYVSDFASSTIYAFNQDAALVDYLETGVQPGSMKGLEVAPDGTIYVLDATANLLVRIQALPEG